MKTIAEVTLADMAPVPSPPANALRMMPPPDAPIRRVTSLQSTPSWQDTYSTRPGYGLTPERVYRIYRTAESGLPAEQCDMFEDVIENDGHLAGLVDGRIEGVSGVPWIVKPGDASDLSLTAARILEDALVEANTDEMIEHHLLGRFMGYSGSEVAWEFRDGWWVPVWFVNMPHKRFVFDQHDYPHLATDGNSWPGEELRGSWLWTGTRHRQAVRGGLMRTATWWSVFKRMSVRDWIIFAEKFGIPIPIGVYKSNAGDETRKVVEQAVMDIGEAGQAVMSDAAKIVFAEHSMRSGDNTALHPSVVQLCNNELSKLITGATLQVESGGNGSYAQASVHENRGLALMRRDARRLATTFRRWVGALFLKLNGIRGVRPPTLWSQVLPETDLLTRAKVASILTNEMGLELDEGQAREEFGWRPPAPGTRPVRGTKNKATDTPTEDDDDDEADAA